MALAFKGATFASVSATTPVIAINYVDRSSRVRMNSLRIDDVLNDAPNQATFTVVGIAPSVGQDVKIGIGGIGPSNRVFGGTIVSSTQIYEDIQSNVAYQVTCQDYTYLLRRRWPIGAYTSQSATAVARDLILRYASTLFSGGNIASSLPTVTIAFDGTQDLAGCLTTLATMAGCYWYPDANRDVHFFVTEATGNPSTIDATNIAVTNPTGARHLAETTDITQERTRVYVRYKPTTTVLVAAVGATTLTVTSSAALASAGSIVSGAQRVTYTAIGLGYTANFDTWTARTGLSAASTAVLWVDTLALYVTLSNGTAFTSSDGITWTSHAVTAGNWGPRIVWASSLSLLLAVNTTRGSVFSSPDGTTWTEHTLSEVNLWNAVAWSPTLGLFALVAQSGTHRVATSPDGTTWTLRTAASASSWTSIVWADALGLFVAQFFSGGGGNTIMTSPDGTTWTAHAGPVSGNDLEWSHALGLLVSAGTGVVYTSPDGSVWTARSAASSNTWVATQWIAELSAFVMVSSDTTGSSQQVATSTDGITWTGRTAQAGTWAALAWSATLGRIVAVGSGTTKEMSSDATTYPALTGIPASGVGAIVTAIAAGDPVVPEVQRDDLTAQATLAALEGGDGVHEYVITDESLQTSTAATTRGDAELALFKNALQEVTYSTRDIVTRSGKTVTVSLGSPTSISVALQIQQVTWTQFDAGAGGQYPLLTVKAAQTKFTLQDLLRRVTVA